MSPHVAQSTKGRPDDTKTLAHSDAKDNFRSEEVFPRPRNLSIDFVPDMTPYKTTEFPRVFICVVRGAMHSGKKYRNALWLNAMHSGKK